MERDKAFVKHILDAIEGMRNKLIHEYFGVNMTVVWETVESDLPILKKAAKQILESLK